MKCPRCETSRLEERDRDGVIIDVCQQCRGIWLDRSELERLIARAADAHDSSSAQRGDRHDDDDDENEPRQFRTNAHYDQQFRRRRKRSWLESLTDIFD